MSTIATALVVIVIISAAGTYAVLRWAVPAESDRMIRETHERADVAREIDALELAYALPSYTPPDLELDAGCERLWDAIRDEQQKGEL